MVTIAREHALSSEEMRHAYCQTLIELAADDARIVTVDCDLSRSCGTTDFAVRYPERAFNVGIQEANGCCVAAGLSVAGMIPFYHTFAAFASRRIFDQVFLSCAYAKANVKIIGCDAGISAAFNGGTHTAFEDVGIMRTIPGITIFEPSDAVMIKELVRHMATHFGVFYLRMPRKQVEQLYEPGSAFTPGKALTLREGTDVTIIASGMMVIEAIKAAARLHAEGIEARVVDMFTIKPIDEACIKAAATQTGAIVTAENHNVIGGLRSAVAEVIAASDYAPLECVGVQDEFGEVGTISYLRERFGLNAEEICRKARAAIARKRHA